ncbi:MAG: LytR C-terminal domain-containing protein [Candidatus Eisenbacteria bacterium]|nr:LytR C-terminal domain-containing protein [Candidatus Eisenbacteria bacterium]
MAKKRGGSVGSVFARLSITHLYVVGVVVLVVVLVYPLLRGEKQRQREPVGLALDVRVMVLNGCGAEGVAEDVAASLRDGGFDIVGTGNADAFDYEHTLVVDRCGSGEKALKVGRALDCGLVLTQRVSAPSSDVVVVVGSDWRDLRLSGSGNRARRPS